jgi:hypothetical protein
MVIALMVVFANRNTVKLLLIGCVAIDGTDIISAYLSGLAGLFDASDSGWLLKLTSTAIAALILEIVALLLLSISKISEPNDVETSLSIDRKQTR